jgi:hypothetical protein
MFLGGWVGFGIPVIRPELSRRLSVSALAILHHSRILLGSMGVSGELPKTKHL